MWIWMGNFISTASLDRTVSLIFVAWQSGLQCQKLQNSPVARLTLPCFCLPPSTCRCESSTVQSLLNGVGGTQTGELGWDRLYWGTWSVVGLRHAPAAWIQTTGLRWVGSCSVQMDPTAVSWELESPVRAFAMMETSRTLYGRINYIFPVIAIFVPKFVTMATRVGEK